MFNKGLISLSLLELNIAFTLYMIKKILYPILGLDKYKNSIPTEYFYLLWLFEQF